MVEHAAVNRGVVGSSPTSGANFVEENGGLGDSRSRFCASFAVIGREDPKGEVFCRHRAPPILSEDLRREAQAIYAFYRVAYMAGGKQIVRSFAKFNDAQAEVEAKVCELAKGNQTAALPSKDAAAALAIRDALDAIAQRTGRRFTALEAVTGYPDAAVHLPGGSMSSEGFQLSIRSHFAEIFVSHSSRLLEKVRRIRKA